MQLPPRPMLADLGLKIIEEDADLICQFGRCAEVLRELLSAIAKPKLIKWPQPATLVHAPAFDNGALPGQQIPTC